MTRTRFDNLYTRTGRIVVHLVCIMELVGMHRPKRAKHWPSSITRSTWRHRKSWRCKALVLAGLAWAGFHLLLEAERVIAE